MPERQLTMTALLDRVPCVLGIWAGLREPRWWPVLPSPLHHDKEYLDFPAWHFHVDGRYLTNYQNQAALGDLAARNKFGFHPMYISPLVTFVRPGTHERIFNNEDVDRVKSFLTGCRRTRLLQQLRPMPPTPAYSEAGSFQRLFDAYPDPVAAGGRCPHKGADLTGLPCNSDGTVTCPLHGLRVRL